MDIEKNKYETPKQQKVGEPGSAGVAAQGMLKRGADVYVHAEQAVSEAYDKTTQVVGKTYRQAKNYSTENPGKTILIASGIGVGVGYLLSAGSRTHSRNRRYAQPVVKALSELATKYFR